MAKTERKEKLNTEQLISIFAETWKDSLSGKISPKDRKEVLQKVLDRFEKENPDEFKRVAEDLDEKNKTILSKSLEKIISNK